MCGILLLYLDNTDTPVIQYKCNTYDHSGRLILEYDEDAFTYAPHSPNTREFIFLYDGEEIIGVMHRYRDEVLQPYYFRKNLQGDVTAIYDGSGTKIGEYTYDAYGNCSVTYGMNNDVVRNNPIRYRSYYYDRETKLYYLNARYYDPALRRFLSLDSTEYLDPETPNGLNLYAYCYNDPVNYADPSGHFALSSFLAGLGIAAAIGAGVSAAAYTAGQGLEYALTKTWEWSWNDLINHTIGGAIGGIAIYCLGGFGGASFGALVGGFSSNATTMVLENLAGNENHAFTDIILSSVVAGMLSAMSAGIMNKMKITGLNAGKGSFSSVTRQIYTKFYRGQIKRIALKTFGKMFASDAYGGIAELFVDQKYVLTKINDLILN